MDSAKRALAMVRPRQVRSTPPPSTPGTGGVARPARPARACGGYFIDPRRCNPGDRSRDTTIVGMAATQDREGDNVSPAHIVWFRQPCSRRDRPRDPSMGPGVVEVRDIRTAHTPPVGLARNQGVIQALPPHAAEEALAGRAGPRRANGRAPHPDAGRRGHLVEARPVLAVVVADAVPRTPIVWRGLARLPGDPVSWLPWSSVPPHGSLRMRYAAECPAGARAAAYSKRCLRRAGSASSRPSRPRSDDVPRPRYARPTASSSRGPGPRPGRSSVVRSVIWPGQRPRWSPRIPSCASNSWSSPAR